MATYLHNRKANYYEPEDIPIGGGSLEIGAKILEDVFERPGEMYVMSQHGKKKIWLTEGGVYKPDVSRLIRKADAYKAGPTIAILGTPSNPRYLMWAATDETEGEDWKPVEMKSYQDIMHYLEIGHSGLDPGKFAGSYGSLGVDIFENKPSDIWTGVADFNRTTNAFALPVMDMVLDEFTGGMGSLFLQVTGIQDKIGEELDKVAAANEDISKGYTSNVTKTDDNMADFITDPRLEPYFDAVKKQSAHNASQYPQTDNGKEINKIVTRFHEGTPKWRMKKLRKLEEANLNLTGDVQMQTLVSTVAKLKEVVPDYDWQSIQNDMKTASSSADKIQMVEKYGAEIQNNVMPLLQQKMYEQQQQQQQQALQAQNALKTPEQPPEPKNYPSSTTKPDSMPHLLPSDIAKPVGDWGPWTHHDEATDSFIINGPKHSSTLNPTIQGNPQ